MKKDIILAGVGGQGILSIAATIGTAALDAGMHMKQAEVHGMSQRGGDVQSHLRISSEEISSDLIPEGKADLIIAVEPLESLRYLPMLSADGWVITSMSHFKNIPDYPDEEVIAEKIKTLPQHVALDADKIAKDLGSLRSANIVVLGAAAQYLGLGIDALEQAIRKIFKAKGEEVVKVNLDAFRAGLKVARESNQL